MATLEDVRRIALGLPESVEAAGHDGAAAWKVGRGLFVWERAVSTWQAERQGGGGEPQPVRAST